MQDVLEKKDVRDWLVIENEGEKMFGMLHLPHNQEKACPIVVVLHGFASSKHGKNRAYVKMAEHFAEQGLATLRVDFRGSGDSEGCLTQVSISDMVSDALAMYEATQGIELIDHERMGVFGSSLGGAVAMLSAAAHGGVKSVALWAPVASGELWYRDFLSQNPELLKKDPKEAMKTYRGVKLHPKFQEEFGKLTAAKALEDLSDVPLLHMHGEDDLVVSCLHQQVYKMHSEGRDSKTRFIAYPDGEHSLGHSPLFQEVLNESAQWFLETL